MKTSPFELMRKSCWKSAVWAIALSISAYGVRVMSAQSSDMAPLRAPATPLVAHDPYFSVWSMNDKLTDGPTRHWTGDVQPMNGLVRVDGKTYRFLGDADRDVPALDELSREITPTRTIVTLGNAQVELKLTFLTPAFPEDLKVMSRPVIYLTW